MCAEMEVGNCEVCGNEGPLIRTYFHYPVKCECHGPCHSIMIRHCPGCVPKEPRETKIVFKTEDMKNPVAMAVRVIQDALNEDHDHGSYYDSWISNIACCVMDQFNDDPKSHEKANKAAEAFLRLLCMPTDQTFNKLFFTDKEMKKLGIELPSSSQLTSKKINELKPGDYLFSYDGKYSLRDISHTVIQVDQCINNKSLEEFNLLSFGITNGKRNESIIEMNFKNSYINLEDVGYMTLPEDLAIAMSKDISTELRTFNSFIAEYYSNLNISIPNNILYSMKYIERHELEVIEEMKNDPAYIIAKKKFDAKKGINKNGI